MMYRIFGEAPAIKIVEWMIDNQEFDHSTKEIVKGTNQSIVVVKRNFEPLINYGVVKVNRTVGRDPMYILDTQNRCTKAIIEFDKQIARCCEHPEEDVGEEADGVVEMDEVHECMMAGPLEV